MADGHKATLIFPCCVPEGVAYAAAARRRREPVVAASSLAYDVTAGKFETWFWLPTIYDSDFVPRLQDAVARHNIAKLYCPVAAAHVALTRLFREGKLSIPIIGEMPAERSSGEHLGLKEAAVAAHGSIQAIAGGRSPLSALEVAAVLRQALAIFGESDEAKIAAMMAIFADAPSGDCIEIGVLAGRTASVLALMAQRHGTGAVLVVDSWSRNEAAQRESSGEVQAAVDGWETAALFESFVVALLPIAARGRFNYLAVPSRQAFGEWSEKKATETPFFGAVDYSGTISVLHVDGNHDFARVSEDCALWLPHLASGGWLVLDDYFSLHCDGPRRVGDALLEQHVGRVERAFVCGKALFVKLAGTAHD
jgi:hypothetical protein